MSVYWACTLVQTGIVPPLFVLQPRRDQWGRGSLESFETQQRTKSGTEDSHKSNPAIFYQLPLSIPCTKKHVCPTSVALQITGLNYSLFKHKLITHFTMGERGRQRIPFGQLKPFICSRPPLLHITGQSFPSSRSQCIIHALLEQGSSGETPSLEC